MNKMLTKCGLSFLEISKMEYYLTNAMLIQLGTLLFTHNIAEVRFDKIPEDSWFKPNIKDEYYGEIIGISHCGDGEYGFIIKKENEEIFINPQLLRIYYDDVKILLNCLETCTATKNRKTNFEKGILIKK